MGIKIENIKGQYPVYDIKVANNHNFYANDILVHNCIEIMQYTDEETTAICTLASQVLKNYVVGKKFDFEKLRKTTHEIVRALNKVIDINAYATEKGKKGGLEQRAIAIGVQGLADVFFMLDYIFTSEEAKKLNKDIFETIYFAAIEASCNLVKEGKYKPYKYFKGSPMSKGIFQFDMWGIKEDELSGMWDWNALKEDVKKNGICNSLFTAQMPVASSAKITASYEMTEPMDSNLFNRRVIGGEFVIANRYLIEDLEKLGIWSEEFKDEIIQNNGSIQNINFLKYLDEDDKQYDKKVERCAYLLEKYKTIWEIKQKDLIAMAADRGVFIDQSQSMNIYMANPTLSKITSSMFYSWEKGLKTGSYYLRTKAISTGAKHLAISLKEEQNNNTVTEEDIEIKEGLMETENNINKDAESSQFECFGCSS